MSDRSLRKSSKPPVSKPDTSLPSNPWAASKKRARPQTKSEQPSKRSKHSTSPPTPNDMPEDHSKDSSNPSESTATATSDAPKSSSPKPTAPNSLTISETRGDFFVAPSSTLLLHACNTEGSWGAGIALAFKKSYPAAFTLYAAHCRKWSSSLLGSCLLIPPQTTSSSRTEREAGHWIGCLFTSARKGKAKGSVESILEATGEAMGDLCRKLGEEGKGKVGEVRMPKINSGLFRVPWARTKAVIEGVEVDEGGWVGEVVVVSLD